MPPPKNIQLNQVNDEHGVKNNECTNAENRLQVKIRRVGEFEIRGASSVGPVEVKPYYLANRCDMECEQCEYRKLSDSSIG